MTKKLKPLNGIIIFIVAFILLLTAGSYLQYNLGVTGLALTEIMFAFLAVLSAMIFKADLKEAFPMRLPPIRSFFGGIMMYGGIYLLMMPVAFITQYFFPDGVGAVSDSLTSIMATSSPFVSIIVFALLPAICEELLMRGVILSSLKPIKSKALIVIIIGVMFGLMHCSIYKLLPTAMLGGVFALIALETDSIVLPILFHFINNAISVVSVYQASALLDASASSGSITLGLASIIGVSILYIAIAIPLLYFGNCLLKHKKPKINMVAVIIVVTVVMLIGGAVTTVFSSVKIVYSNSIEENITEEEYRQSYDIEIESDGQYIISISSICIGGETSYKLKAQSEEVLDSEPYGVSISKNSSIYLEKGIYHIEIAASKDEDIERGTLGSQIMITKIGR